MKQRIKITEITISRGCTINMGDFQSERIDVSMTAQVHTVDIEAATKELIELVEDELDTLSRACTEDK